MSLIGAYDLSNCSGEFVGIFVSLLVVGLVDGILVGLLDFLVGTDVVGLKVCTAVGVGVGPAVLG